MNPDMHEGKGLCVGGGGARWPRVTKEVKRGEAEEPVGHNKPPEQTRAGEQLWTLRNRLKLIERIYH